MYVCSAVWIRVHAQACIACCYVSATTVKELLSNEAEVARLSSEPYKQTMTFLVATNPNVKESLVPVLQDSVAGQVVSSAPASPTFAEDAEGEAAEEADGEEAEDADAEMNGEEAEEEAAAEDNAMAGVEVDPVDTAEGDDDSVVDLGVVTPTPAAEEANDGVGAEPPDLDEQELAADAEDKKEEEDKAKDQDKEDDNAEEQAAKEAALTQAELADRDEFPDDFND